jgi:hypothetical protein
LRRYSQSRRACANHICRWDDWVSQERIRKLTDENKELAANLRKDMDAQRRATSGRPSMASATKKRGLGSDAPGSSARGSEDRSSVAPPPPPRGTKRAREIEGIDKVCCLRLGFFGVASFPAFALFSWFLCLRCHLAFTATGIHHMHADLLLAICLLRRTACFIADNIVARWKVCTRQMLG